MKSILNNKPNLQFVNCSAVNNEVPTEIAEIPNNSQ